MGWRAKSAQFKFLSMVPGGTALYNYTQEKITKSTLASPMRVDQKLNVGLELWEWAQKNNCSGKLIDGNLLDLGAGWHPTIPLLWYAFGNNQQTLVDVFPNMDARKANDTIRFFRTIVGDPKFPARSSVTRLPEAKPSHTTFASEVLSPLGIEYHAPYGDLLQRNAGHYDVVICTQVLQHIPKQMQSAIFKELFSALKSGGLFHATVHFVGQFRSPGLNTGQYEHLSYSPTTWENWINSPLMGFNRLKGPDYRETLEQAGFRIREFKLTLPTLADMAELKQTRVHPSFSHYSDQELATRGVSFVAEKP
jgi:hypothetical protein